ncbi:MAG: VOC family protein [Gemmatimonadaceae bacterium]|nr:VOC family protein [Gemmatimonadaceae bacterium]
MVVEHLALWTRDLERLRDFYTRWFGATANAVYESRRRQGFRSHFLTFPGGGSRLEIMAVPDLDDALYGERVGFAHVAVAIGPREAVDALCAQMRDAGVPVRSAPRETGDGYYEAVLEDPDGNLLEIMATPG